MIRLHHGSNVEIDAIDLSRSKKGKDFGQGFYLNPNYNQALEMAEFKLLPQLDSIYGVWKDEDIDWTDEEKAYIRANRLAIDINWGCLEILHDRRQQYVREQIGILQSNQQEQQK